VRVRELVRQVCRDEEVEILKGHVSRDHVHLFVSIPPQVTIRRLPEKNVPDCAGFSFVFKK
jgi:putative transposase